VVTGDVADGRALRVLKRDMKNPLSREGKLSRRVPEIKFGDGNVPS
jgi:hypothetical protein